MTIHLIFFLNTAKHIYLSQKTLIDASIYHIVESKGNQQKKRKPKIYSGKERQRPPKKFLPILTHKQKITVTNIAYTA